MKNFRCKWLGWHKYEYSTLRLIGHVRVAWMECECGLRSRHAITYLEDEVRRGGLNDDWL